MYLLIQHSTYYRYSEGISENMMELRLQPRSDGAQRCLSFQLQIRPAARLFDYRDIYGNIAHHFDVPGEHDELEIYSEALVETRTAPPLPRDGKATWQALAHHLEQQDVLDLRLPSPYTESRGEVERFLQTTGLRPDGDDVLAFVYRANATVHRHFTYKPKSTTVDTHVDEALARGEGVCQDYAHSLLAVLRHFGVPARYVSGYLYNRETGAEARMADATHAWVEALIPPHGWVGFDPTANLICGERHIRTAIGRDYADIPPTKGVYKGDCGSELDVWVRVSQFGVQGEKAKPPRRVAAKAEPKSSGGRLEPAEQ